MSNYLPLSRFGSEQKHHRKRKKLDRLTRDAIAAERAGMSYGQWKATHPHTPDEDEPTGPAVVETTPVVAGPGMVLATCLYCGKEFTKRQSQTTKKFCSEACQQQHHSAQLREMRRQANPGRTAVCPICGAEFVTNNQHRIYCNKKCYREAQRKRDAKMREQRKMEVKNNGTN